MAAASDRTSVAQKDARSPISLRPAPTIYQRLNQDDQARLDCILVDGVEFINHDSFTRAATARKLFRDRVAGRWSPQPWCNSAKSGSKISKIIHKTTLTSEEERQLFLCYNYARFRMAKLLRQYGGKRLTGKATTELLWWHTKSMETRAEIVQANMPLVLAMAKRTRLGNVDYAELISEGNMALLRSVHKFDCGRGFKFSTYACRAILKSFSRVAMRTSRYRGRFPTEFDPSLEKSNYVELCRQAHEADCVDELLGIIRSNSADLNDAEYKVIHARFALGKVEGIECDRPKTLEQVGLVIGVTKERVRQIQNKALEKLRLKLQDDFLAA